METILPKGRALAGVVLVHVALVIGWATLVPPFEHPDEVAHFAYLQFVAAHWRQPVQSGEIEPWVEPESQQPPLYYFIGALPYAMAVALGLPQTDPGRLRVNEAYYGLAASRPAEGGPDTKTNIDPFDRSANRVYFVHDRSAWPTEPGYPWDVLVTRLLSLLYSIPLVAVALACGALLWPAGNGAGPRPPAILLALLIALHPQLLFISTGVTNDVLAHLAGGLAAFYAYLVLGDRISADRQVVLLGGILAGFLVWSKATLYPLLPLVFLVPLLKVLAASPRRAFMRAALMLAIAAVISAPVFLRNLALYHDLLGRQEIINPMAYAWNLAPKSLTDAYFAPGGTFLTLLWLSSVGVFGMMDVFMPALYFAAWSVFVRLSAAGLALRLLAGAWRRIAGSGATIWRRLTTPTSDQRLTSTSESAPAPLGHLTAAIVGAALSVAGVVVYNLSVTQPQGRYLFPAAIFWATCLVAGLEVWINLWPQSYRQRVWRYLPALAATALISVNMVAWFTVLIPTYAR